MRVKRCTSCTAKTDVSRSFKADQISLKPCFAFCSNVCTRRIFCSFREIRDWRSISAMLWIEKHSSTTWRLSKTKTPISPSYLQHVGLFLHHFFAAVKATHMCNTTRFTGSFRISSTTDVICLRSTNTFLLLPQPSQGKSSVPPSTFLSLGPAPVAPHPAPVQPNERWFRQQLKPLLKLFSTPAFVNFLTSTITLAG